MHSSGKVEAAVYFEFLWLGGFLMCPGPQHFGSSHTCPPHPPMHGFVNILGSSPISLTKSKGGIAYLNFVESPPTQKKTTQKTNCECVYLLVMIISSSSSHRNGLNFFFKLLAWVYTGSASMFSEAIHSLTDTCNQVSSKVCNFCASQGVDAMQRAI